MTKLHPADLLIAGGLTLTGLGIHFLFPAVIPYFFLFVGILMAGLGCLGIVKGRRKIDVR